MAKRTVVLASLLKPVDDVRMYEKFGLALTQLPGLSVHLIGFASKRPVSHPQITFHPLFNFPRLSVRRFTAPWKYYKRLIQLKPDVIVVTSPDLLIVTIIYRILFGCSIIYDVQEDYYCNLLHMGTFPFPVNYLLAAGVRTVEWLTRPFIFQYLLAEKVYCKELQFTKRKRIVVENKYKPNDLAAPESLVREDDFRFRLLYTGTISETYGIYRAIELAEALHSVDNRYSLILVGYCAKQSEYTRLLQRIAGRGFITVVGGNALVPHEVIIQYMQQGGTGLMPYLPNKCTEKRVPTKLYEYLFHQIPVLLPDNPHWWQVAAAFPGVIKTNFDPLEAESIHQQLICIPVQRNYSLPYPTLLWSDKEFISIFSNIVNRIT